MTTNQGIRRGRRTSRKPPRVTSGSKVTSGDVVKAVASSCSLRAAQGVDNHQHRNYDRDQRTPSRRRNADVVWVDDELNVSSALFFAPDPAAGAVSVGPSTAPQPPPRFRSRSRPDPDAKCVMDLLLLTSPLILVRYCPRSPCWRAACATHRQTCPLLTHRIRPPAVLVDARTDLAATTQPVPPPVSTASIPSSPC